MTDLVGPGDARGEVRSCHIGNPDEQKVVTHAMYAAGHPPLPGFETATFSDAEPRHWQYLREKKSSPRRPSASSPTSASRPIWSAASGIVALRETMRLYAAQARPDGSVKGPRPHWPDFARFDCYCLPPRPPGAELATGAGL